MFCECKDCFTIVEVLAWIKDNVLLEDVRTGLRYVLTSDEFLQFHRVLKYECDVSEYEGANLSWLEAE
jgi:hypothetical protein